LTGFSDPMTTVWNWALAFDAGGAVTNAPTA
jgi:hypothetical protein